MSTTEVCSDEQNRLETCCKAGTASGDTPHIAVSTPLSSKACAFSISSIMAGVTSKNEEKKKNLVLDSMVTDSLDESDQEQLINSRRMKDSGVSSERNFANGDETSYYLQSPNSLGPENTKFKMTPDGSSPSSSYASSSLRASSSSSSTSSSSSSSYKVAPDSSSLSNVTCRLEPKDLWERFHHLGTEMIITKSGRRMFPTIRLAFGGEIHPEALYDIAMEITPVDRKRYRYVYHRSSWVVAGRADPPKHSRLYFHPESPFTGHQLLKQNVSFEKLKLTNNMNDITGQIILNSMHRYQPRIYIFFHQPHQVNQQPEIHSTSESSPTVDHSFDQNTFQSRRLPRSTSSQRDRPIPASAILSSRCHKCFTFPETTFTAVTAYQNQLITKLKIDSNPFAKGFRDSMRLVDIDRCRENVQPDLHSHLSMTNSSKLLKARSTHPSILGGDCDKDLNKQLHKNFHDFIVSHSGKRKLEESEMAAGKDKIHYDSNQNSKSAANFQHNLNNTTPFQHQQQHPLSIIHPTSHPFPSIHSSHNLPPRYLLAGNMRIPDASFMHPQFIYALCSRLSPVLPSFNASIFSNSSSSIVNESFKFFPESSCSPRTEKDPEKDQKSVRLGTGSCLDVEVLVKAEPL